MLASLCLGMGMVLAGCGTTGSTGGGLYGSGGASTPSTGTGGSTGGNGAQIGTATATVAGTSETILTNGAGRTLYYFADDTATSSQCTGACAQTWPPALAGASTPTAASALPGTLSVLNDGNGAQVTYNGHPLYIYSGDAAPGDTHGEGIEGKWHVATPTLAAQSAGAGQVTPTATSTCTGYGCY
jgi:predicted lipoprotein with Yx(FWY)xxD motif